MAALLLMILLLAIGGYTPVCCDQPGNVANEIVDVMVSCGFENVRTSILSDSLVVEYENRIYFREKDAIRTIVPKIMEQAFGKSLSKREGMEQAFGKSLSKRESAAQDIQTLILLLKKNDVPLLQIIVSRDDYLASMGDRDIVDEVKTSRKIDHALVGRKYNSSAGKVDIILRPELDSLIGCTNDPFMYQFAISPEFSTFLGKGIGSHAQLRLLLHDDLEHSRKRVALSRLCLDHTYRSPVSTFVNLGGGYFGDNRYGLACEVSRFGWGSRLGVGGTAAWLGNMSHGDGTLYYTKMWKWTALASLHCRLPFWNVLLTTRFGQFLYRDRGISAEITRFFRNTAVTIFTAKTDDGSIGGFEVQFLTYPRRHLVPHRVRVRLPTTLKVRYRQEENGVGVVFSPGHYIDPAVERFWLIDLE